MPHSATRYWEAASDCVPCWFTAPARHCRSPRISWMPPLRRWNSFIRIHWSMTICRPWTTMICAAGNRRRTALSMKPRRFSPAMRLQVLAFSLLSRDRTAGVTGDARLKMIQILADASGTAGMAGGQAIDLAAVGKGADAGRTRGHASAQNRCADSRERADGGGLLTVFERGELGCAGRLLARHRTRFSNPG